MLGLASGAGFGIAEGIIYCGDFYNGIMGPGVYYVRFISCVALHSVWSALAAITVFQNRGRFVAADGIGALLGCALHSITLAAVLHGFYDTLLKKECSFLALLLAAGSVLLLAYRIQAMRRLEASVPAGGTHLPAAAAPTPVR